MPSHITVICMSSVGRAASIIRPEKRGSMVLWNTIILHHYMASQPRSWLESLLPQKSQSHNFMGVPTTMYKNIFTPFIVAGFNILQSFLFLMLKITVLSQYSWFKI